jgi:opacity protein-like surface antigen
MTLRHACRYLTLLAVALTAAIIHPAHAAGPLNLYFGGGVGQGEVETNSTTIPIFYANGEFKESSPTLEAVLGIRPIRYLGAEIGYVDFGRPYGNVGAFRDHVSMQAETAFGVLYLPIPVIDLYGKFGVARTHVDASNVSLPLRVFSCPAFGPCPICPVGGCPVVPTSASRTSTNFAFGAGVQYKFVTFRGAFGSMSVRLEYDRFRFGGETPSQAALGVIWTFL